MEIKSKEAERERYINELEHKLQTLQDVVQ